MENELHHIEVDEELLSQVNKHQCEEEQMEIQILEDHAYDHIIKMPFQHDLLNYMLFPPLITSIYV